MYSSRPIKYRRVVAVSAASRFPWQPNRSPPLVNMENISSDNYIPGKVRGGIKKEEGKEKDREFEQSSTFPFPRFAANTKSPVTDS